MIFGKDSRTQIPAINNLGFAWVNKIKVLGITLTCDLKEMKQNFQEKLESIEKMLKHWSYRTLNLEGRITIIKSLALSKVSHLAIVLPELDEQQATRLEKLTFDFIWKIFNDQVKQGQVRINKERAKIEQEKEDWG